MPDETPPFLGKPYTLENTHVGAQRCPAFFAWEEIGGADIDLSGLVAKLKSDDEVAPYKGHNGVPIIHCGVQGVTTIEVLPELVGLPFTNLVLAYLYALRPSTIRVSYGAVYADCHTWRVTVYLDATDKVTKIVQEVEIGYGCGYDVSQVLHHVKTGEEPVAFPGVIGHVGGIARVDFE